MLPLALSANSFAEEATVTKAFLQWQGKSAGDGIGPVSLVVMPPQKGLPGSKPGRVRVNVEPGCLLPDAIVKALPDNRYRFEFPDDDYFSAQARRVLGLKGKACIVRYKPGEKDQASQVLEVTEVEAQKPDEKPAK